MRKCSLSEKQKVFIELNCWVMSSTDIALQLKLDKGVVRRFMYEHDLVPPKEFSNAWRAAKNFRPFTKKEDQFINDHLSTSSIKKIAAQLHRTSSYVSQRAKQLGLGELVKMNSLNSRIRPGSVPKNKGKRQVEYMTKDAINRTKATRFKKGHLPHNTKERDGEITVRHDHQERGGKPYKYIRLSLGKWYPLHQYKWEQKFGKIPKGTCLWFKDGNSLNCSLKNLELITRAENLKRNRENFLEMPPELRKASQYLKKLNNIIYGKKQIK